MLKRDVNQQLGLLSWDQNVVGDAQIESVELAMAYDICQWLSR